MEELIRLEAVRVKYGKTTALDSVDMRVPAGQVTVLLGPNGAGKSTALRLLARIENPDAGRITFSPKLGTSRRSTAYCPQETSIWDNLNIIEQARLVASFYKIPSKTADRRMDEIVAFLGLKEELNKQGRQLSKGNKRKLNILLSLMIEPRLLVLDEPEAELDTASRTQLRALIQDFILSKGATAILSTHQIPEAELLADSVVVLHQGRIVLRRERDSFLAPGSGGLAEAYADATGETV